VIVLPDPGHDTPEVLARAEACLAPLGHPFGREKIEACPRLKVIGSNTTGEPHIDRPFAESRGVRVVSLMNDQEFLATITPTAEHAWGLLLAVTRRLPWAFNAVLAGSWRRWDFGGRRMLSALDLGVVGLGRLGRLVAGYGTAFGMTVRYFDPYVPDPGRDDWHRAARLEELVETSDVVSLHVPLNDETTGLVDRALLDRFKPGACLINTARAEVVDQAALLGALRSGRLAGAGLDVLEGEFAPGFSPAGHPLVEYARTHDNLIITPHIGGSTVDAWARTEARTIERMIAALEGDPGGGDG